MSFNVLFDNEVFMWKNLDYDLFTTIPYENYCRSLPQLHPLLTTLSTYPYPVAPGDTVYVDLRSYGYDWYSTLNLPDADYSTYVNPLTFTSWFNCKLLKNQWYCSCVQ